MKVIENAVVLSNREIAPQIHSMWLKSPKICQAAAPGQFLHVRVKDSFVPLLRRPLSIGRVEDDTLELVWRVVGVGTEEFTRREPGEEVSLLGPLGTGFTVTGDEKHAILVGGGLGVPPVVYLNRRMKSLGIDSHLLIGARTQQDVPLAPEDPVLQDAEVILEQGGEGRSGLVTELAGDWFTKLEASDDLSGTAVYVCGPWGLVLAMQRITPADRLLRSEVSLEQQMGCGIGVCQGCAVRVKGGPTPYQLVCLDGPVFPLFDVEAPHGK